ncbi:ferredoxin reductase [Mycobacterium sp. AMU20-3851]|uniref:ferredoxin reductase n=1 Tax=Mycobacterium sp. AMU20-3851 TaxID=3122055 RepID=UPI003754C59A
MFTETLTQRVSRSSLLKLLTGPHGIDRYTELVDPTWTQGQARARIVAVRRQTPRSVTLTLQPNRAFAGFRAGQHINVSVEIDGRRRTRCYSPANAEGSACLEITVGRHDGGLVSTYLCDEARPGMIVGLDSVAGDFVLPDTRPSRILFVSGGSGITPVLAMLRTLRAEGFTGEIAFVHYSRSAAEACYRAELDAMPGVRVLHGYTRDTAGADLHGHFGPDHLAAAMPDPEAVFVCGPAVLIESMREVYPDARSESFVPPVFAVPVDSTGGTVTFTASGVEVTDSGQTLLEQAEAAGLNPESGCRMGICFSCTRPKTRGVVRNLLNGTVSTDDCEDVRICVSAPVGDVAIDL